MNETEKFLEEIRAFNGLKNAILIGISVVKRTGEATFLLVTDKAYLPDEERGAVSVCQKSSGAVAPVAPLCKGSCHADGVTEGLTR